MKAIMYEEYGSPEVLQLKEVEQPHPRKDEVLVKVQAVSVNAGDLETLRGVWSSRFEGPFKPKHKIPGTDVAGVVAAAGSRVTKFQPGDEVWGDLSFPHGFGSFAEYVCVSPEALAHKPASLSFEEAATYPHSALISLQNIRDKGSTQPGHKVLINGAGGGMGTFMVQLAKHFGAETTAVDAPEKFEMLRMLGADHCIDYTQTDYTRTGQCYDLIIDVVAYRSAFDYARALSPTGRFIIIGGSLRTFLQVILLGAVISRFGEKKIGINKWDPNNPEDLAFLAELYERRQVVPVIDQTYSLAEVPEAFRYLEAGKAQGKLVVKVAQD